MLDSLERFDVKAGDTILIEGGMPHAIGAGCFLVEIQEPTDFTIRVERTTPRRFAVDDFLCHQGLGFDKMFDVFHYEETSREEIMRKYFIKPSNVKTYEAGESATLVGYENTPMFRLDELRVSGSLNRSRPAVRSAASTYSKDAEAARREDTNTASKKRAVLRPRRSRRHDPQRETRQPAAHTALPRPRAHNGEKTRKFAAEFEKNSGANSKDVILYPALNRGHSSVGRALASQAKGRGFESRCPLQREASVAQLVEQRTRNAQVSGSSPDAGSIHRIYSSSVAEGFFIAFPALVLP